MNLKSILAICALALSSTTLAFAEPVNINTASAEEISQALNGIGTKKAEAIVEHRKANGPFKHAGELSAVKGIGSKIIEKNAKDIQL